MLITSNHIHKAAVGSAALAGILLGLGSTDARAQLATDVACFRCIETSELERHAVAQAKLAPDAVTRSKIADGAVTAAKLASNAVFEHIIVLRADPLDTAGNCNALRDALTDITNNDSDNRYLIHLEPGTYDCGGTAVQMKEFVDLQGSGRTTTLITGSIGNGDGLVAGAANTEIRHLTVENGGADSATAIIADFPTAFRITDVTAIGRDADFSSAILVNSGDAVLTNVTVGASNIQFLGRGVNVINESNVELFNVTVDDANGSLLPDIGLEVEAGIGSTATVTARHSVFRGSDFAVAVDVDDVGNFAASQLDGGTDGLGDFTCVGSYDDAFAALAADCS